jgi:hypothetical protein
MQIISFSSRLLEFPDLLFLLELRHVLPLQPFLYFLPEALDASVE